MGKLITLILLASINLALRSQVDSSNNSMTDSALTFIKQESSVLSISPKSKFSLIENIYPQFNMYGYWDPAHMNPYRFLTLPQDTRVNINLLGEDCDFSLPLNAPLTSHFGRRWGRPHQGIDLDLRNGDSVATVFDGVVRLSQYYYGYGNLIIIRHYNGLETCYAHLSERYSKVGDLVNAGECIGLGGSTGHSTGSHLHFEVRYMGKPLDPERIIDFKNAQLKTDILHLKPKFFKTFTCKSL